MWAIFFMTHAKQMSAAAFAKGLLDLEGQLTPILVCGLSPKKNIWSVFLLDVWLIWLTFLKVSLVSKDYSMLDGLENASSEMKEAKVCTL